MSRHPLSRLYFAILILSTCARMVSAETVPLANSSFESPRTLFVDLAIDGWQKTPKPEWYVETGGFTWSQLTGTFKNSPPGNFDHIDNCDGDQAIWTFAIPSAGVYQDLGDPASAPANVAEQTSTYLIGKAYKLTVGVIGMGGGMSNGVTAVVALYFRDAQSNQVIVASNSITNSPLVFSNRTHLIDFSTTTQPVRSEDPWAGQPLGILIMSTVPPELQGGYWDFDHVRLEVLQDASPRLKLSGLGDQFFLEWNSLAGVRYQVQVSDDLYTWKNDEEPVEGTGSVLSRSFAAKEKRAHFFRIITISNP